MQADLKNSRRDRLQFYIFDLPFFDGFDLRAAPLIERKAVLEKLFIEAGKTGTLLYSQHLDAGQGAAMFQHACAHDWEGIVSKDINAPYRSERTKAWLKIKCSQEARLPVIGFVRSDSGDTIASLHLARPKGDDLFYAGKVGTGFSRQTSRAIWERLNKIVTPTMPLARKVRIPKARWTEPKYFTAVEYRDITNDGLLRHCSFIGLYDRPQGGLNCPAASTPRRKPPSANPSKSRAAGRAGARSKIRGGESWETRLNPLDETRSTQNDARVPS